MTNSQFIDTFSKIFAQHPRIFKEIYKEQSYNDEPSVFQYNIVFKDKPKDVGEIAIATGISFEKETALVKACGEAIERYSLSAHDNPTSKPTKYTNNTTMLHPSCFSFGENVKNLEYEKFRWIKCTNITTNKVQYIPAQLIYVPYKYFEQEKHLLMINSSGAACGSSFEDAILRGIYELIERDSFLVSYLVKRKCQKINLNAIVNKKINHVIEKIKRYNLEIHLILTSTDIPIFSLCALIIDKSGIGPSISVGLKAGHNIEDVVIGALEESLMTRTWIRDKFFGHTRSKPQSKDSIETIEDRARFWLSLKMINKLDFWLKYQNNTTLKQAVSDKYTNGDVLSKILLYFQENSIDCFVVDISAKLFNKCPFKVVKVVIPRLQGMYLNENYPNLNMKRVSRFVKINSNEDVALNPIPHPFL